MALFQYINTITSGVVFLLVIIGLILARKYELLDFFKKNGNDRNTIEDIRHHAEIFSTNSRHLSYIRKDLTEFKRQHQEDMKEIRTKLDNHIVHTGEDITSIKKDIEYLKEKL